VSSSFAVCAPSKWLRHQLLLARRVKPQLLKLAGRSKPGTQVQGPRRAVSFRNPQLNVLGASGAGPPYDSLDEAQCEPAPALSRLNPHTGEDSALAVAFAPQPPTRHAAFASAFGGDERDTHFPAARRRAHSSQCSTGACSSSWSVISNTEGVPAKCFLIALSREHEFR